MEQISFNLGTLALKYLLESADGVLDLVSDNEVEINGTTIDMNGTVDVSGAITAGSTITTT